MEKFPITAKINDEIIELENWMMVAALALADVEWAKQLVNDPNYDLRRKYRDFENRRKRESCKKQIDYHQNEIERLKKVIEESLK